MAGPVRFNCPEPTYKSGLYSGEMSNEVKIKIIYIYYMIDKINIFLVSIIFIAFLVFIVVRLVQNKKKINQMRENFRNQQRYNRECCGNADWHLGEKEYRQMCPDSTPPAFENTRSNHCSYLQENFRYDNDNETDKKNRKECKEKGYELAYNVSCVENGKLRTGANCKCVDNNNNCKICLPKTNHRS
jgi:hypothetical protein